MPRTIGQINFLNQFYKLYGINPDEELDIARRNFLSEKVYIPDFPYHEGPPTLEELENKFLEQNNIL